ncbi:MAG: AAA family ATPase [Bacilli bacterium]|jgi:chromosome segregation protein
MYLKQVKIKGFKSFPNRLTIDFKEGLTGIVGPNGSGKSNIVDAVRWVLGEQSVKSLRGDNSMADVIFSGSKSRNPSSLASVTLVFDNQDKYFPLEYTEVSIKRVVYQTGENEYYLNGEKCRLKDISNLIIDAGLAKESFNIITQGNIQEILSSKPEERRLILEEAAGILKYKKRKEEAIRKLERTHLHMERIEDIILELEKQIIPLKEQKETAKLYLSYQEELEDIEIGLISQDLTLLNHTYQFSKKEIKELEKEIFTLDNEDHIKQIELEKKKLDQIKDNENLHLLHQELIGVTKEVEKLAGQRKLVVERRKYDQDDAKLHEEMLFLKETELKINNDLENLKGDIETKNNDWLLFDKRINDLNEDLKKVNKNQELTLIELNKRIRIKTELNHQIEVLKISISNNERLPRAIKGVLNNEQLDGIHDVLGNLYKTSSTYQTAFNVALGSSSNFVVVDNDYVAKEAITYLKENKLGRVTFFPLNIIKPRKMNDYEYNMINTHSSFIDLASNLITYDEKYQNILLNQLGNVIIARDLKGANEIGKIINHQYKIVTLEGELLHVGGSITGGTLKSNITSYNDQEVLKNKEKQLKRINEEIKELEGKLNDFKINQQEYELKKYNLTIERASLKEMIKNKEESLINYENKLKEIKEEIKGVNDVLNNVLDEEEQSLVNDFYEKDLIKNKLDKRVDNLGKKIKDDQEEIIELEQLLKKKQLLLKDKNNQLKKLEVKTNRLDVQIDNLLLRLNEEYKLTYEKAKEKYILSISIEEARDKVNYLKEEIDKLGVINQGAIMEYERVNERYQFLTLQKNDLFKAENTLLEIIKEMDLITKELFEETFKLINKEFKIVFNRLFKGGTAELKLVNPNNILETGIDIVALPPGKKLQHISLLSGGEKALTAISLLFAILNVKPVPFCILDEVEAPLDEANVLGFVDFLKDLKVKTQFIIITHKKKTMEFVDVLYGITMQESGVSKLVSVKLENITEK